MTRNLYSRFLCFLSICGAGLFLCGCTDPARPDRNGVSQENKPPDKFESLRDQPPSAKTLYALADILATQGKDTESELVLKRCIQEYPRFVPAYNSLAELNIRQGRPREASAVLMKAVSLWPHDPVAANNLGMAYLLQKEHEKALECFTKAASLAPANKKYRANMATALGLLGRQDEAAALLHEILPEQEAEHNAQLLRQAYEKELNSDPNASDRSR